jgi:hypothetical protein
MMNHESNPASTIFFEQRKMMNGFARVTTVFLSFQLLLIPLPICNSDPAAIRLTRIGIMSRVATTSFSLADIMRSKSPEREVHNSLYELSSPTHHDSDLPMSQSQFQPESSQPTSSSSYSQSQSQSQVQHASRSYAPPKQSSHSQPQQSHQPQQNHQQSSTAFDKLSESSLTISESPAISPRIDEVERKNAVLEALSRRHEETIVRMNEELLYLRRRNDEFERVVGDFEPRLKTLKMALEHSINILSGYLISHAPVSPHLTSPTHLGHSTRTTSKYGASSGTIDAMTLPELAQKVCIHADGLSTEVETLRRGNLLLNEQLLQMQNSARAAAEERTARDAELKNLRTELVAKNRDLCDRQGVSLRAQKYDALVQDHETLRSDTAALKAKCAGLESQLVVVSEQNAQLKLMNEKYFGVLGRLQQAEEDKVRLQRQLKMAKDQLRRT